MLIGVVAARRRRVRAGQGRYGVYDGGARFSGKNRSRLLAAGLQHHHHHQNHQGSCSRPQARALLLRAQENLHEQRSETLSSGGPAAAAATVNSAKVQTTEFMSNTHDHSRPFGHPNHHRQTGEETRRSRLSSLWRRHYSSCSHSDPTGLAIEARNRLDELLQAAAHMALRSDSHSSSKNLTKRHSARSSCSTEFLDFNKHPYPESEISRRTGVYNWFVRHVLHMKRCLSRVEVPSPRALSSPRRSSETTSARDVGLGINEGATMMNDLSREAMGCKDTNECPVCLEGFMAGEMPIALPCNHTFHVHCVTPWLSKQGNCPCCRARITKISGLKRRTLAGED